MSDRSVSGQQGETALDVVYLCCMEKWWDWTSRGFVSRPARIARGLARSPRIRRLLVVDEPSSAGGALKRGRRSGLTRVDEKLAVLDHARPLPEERTRPASYRINALLDDSRFLGRIRRAMRELDMERPIAWASGPLVAKYAEGLAVPLVYDAMDEWMADEAQAPMRQEFAAGYERVRRSASTVFAVSTGLAARFAGAAPEVFVVPNGVDLEAYSRAAEVPAALREIPRPLVGYVGMLQDRIDVRLVERVAEELSSVSFVFVGPELDPAHIAPLRRLPNVYLVGVQPYDEVPAFVRAFDVCMLPHVRSPLTECMDPLKVYEYLAAGKPVVSTDVPLVHPPELVLRASDAASFARAIRSCASGEWVADEQLLASYVAAASWDARVETMLSHLMTAEPQFAVSASQPAARVGAAAAAASGGGT